MPRAAFLLVAALIAAVVRARADAMTSGAVTGPVVASEQHPDGAAIDWRRVAAAGHRVAVVQATDGTYRNPWFGTDYAGARAAGIVRGSFAVAAPALPLVSTARQQADFYLARLGTSLSTSRTLAPVLDVESTGGLSRADLVTWLQTFLLRVQARTGRVPVLRTFGYLWSHGLGDTAAFDRFPLWIAATGSAPTGTVAAWGYTAAGRTDGVPAATPMVRIDTDELTWHSMSSGTTPAPWVTSPPGPPQSVTARPYRAAATVAWLPGGTGSSEATSYMVTAVPAPPVTDPTTTLTTAPPAEPAPLPPPASVTVKGDTTHATLTGLTDGTSYRISVTATNAAGTGVAATAPGPVTPTEGEAPLPKPKPVRAQPSLYTHDCAPSTNLVRGTKWHSTAVAPGVVLQEGQHRDARGYVRMHVLRVDVKDPHLRFAPLMRHVADRQRLTSFGSRRGLVAATNAGYFDTHTGAPTAPVVVDGTAVSGPSVPAGAVGFGPDGLLHNGWLAATGTVIGPKDPLPLAGWNASQPLEGINAYTGRWGTHPVPLPGGAVSRLVSNGRVGSGTGHSREAPAHGYLLVARGSLAVGWLRSLHAGDHVTVRTTLESSTREPFTLAWSVGAHLVSGGKAASGQVCKRNERLPARTAIGWSADRRHLILVGVERRPKWRLHGVEPDQMALIMRDLGASEAFLFDGGGSTEMIVRPKPGAPMKLRTYPSDGVERKMPVGFGIFRR